MRKYTFDDIRKQNLLLYEYYRGSFAYGLFVEGKSDMDTGGVFMSPAEQLIGLGFDYQEQIADEKNDNVWLELNKYMLLLLKSNPTVLESLFIPDKCVINEHPIMSFIKENRNIFITKECFNPFGGYAVEQIKKCRGLNKKIVNPVTERLWPLDFCYTFYKQGSSKIKNWLEYRGLNQKYCGLVNIPNMHDVYGCYYDWGNHFLNEDISIDKLITAWNDTTEYDTIKLVKLIKEDGRKDLNAELKKAQFKNMVRFIVNFYHLHDDGPDVGIDFTALNLEKWYKEQKPIGYSGIVGEDGKSNEIRLCSVSKGEMPICWMTYNESGYSKHCVDYKNYKDWEKHRNPVRYESNLNKNYDAKNVSHSFRLIAMCTEIARGDGFNVDRTDIDREFLLRVKNHGYEYDEVIEMLDQKKKEMDEAIALSTIPEKVDVNYVNDMLIDIRRKQLGI